MRRFTFVLVRRFVHLCAFDSWFIIWGVVGCVMDRSPSASQVGDILNMQRWKTQLVPCPRPLVLGIMELCPNLCLQLPSPLMLNLRPCFLGWVLDFCSFKSWFQFLKYVFQNRRFIWFWSQGIWWFQFFAKTNQNQRTASSSSWKESESKNPPPVSVLWGEKKMKKSKESPVLVSLKTFPRNTSFG